MTARLDATDRQDFHNAATNVVAALAGRCGFTHLASGRTCLLRYRHPGPCQLVATGNDPQFNRDHCDEDQCVSAERSCAGRPATAAQNHSTRASA